MLRYGLFLLGLISVTAADLDPCLAGNHVTFDDPTRYTTYDTDLSSVRCDNGTVKQWYRVPFGSVATTPPPVNRCGTTQPVWIEPTTLPSTGETQLVTICLRTTYATCPSTGVIYAKNCGSFYVYELRPLNAVFCPLAYCLERDSSQTVLPSVSTSLVEGTFEIDNEDFPNKEILFTCDLQGNTGVTLETLSYDVVWYIDDQEIKRRTDLNYSAMLIDGALREGEWREQYSLGIQVKCAVEAKTEVSTGTGNFEHSSPFYAGFKAELSGDILQENGELELTIKLTVPLGCTYTNNLATKAVQKFEQDHCHMRIRVVSPKDESTDQCSRGGVTNNAVTFKNNECGVLIYHTSWDTSAVMKIHGAPDNIVNSGHRMALLQLRTDSVITHKVWSQVVGDEIEINIHDDDINIMGKVCYSSNDPHMKTFDGKQYELQVTGEYVLYKHDTLPVAIHAYFQPCDYGLPNAKCNCGIAIRNDNAVFRANFCKHSNGFNRIIEYNGCDKDAMKITHYQSSNRYGSGFQITLPTGTSVTFHYGSYSSAVFIHYIFVKPSVLDWKASAGLCGYMDGSTGNDFKKTDGSETSNESVFGTSWKITEGTSQSLFINPLVTQSSPTMTAREYCTCKNETKFDEHASCSASPAEPCSSSDSSDTASYGYLDTCRTSFTKRDTDEEMVYFPWYSNLGGNNDTESGVPDWSGNWTEASAALACREFLRDSPLIQKCEEVIPGFDSEVYVPDCTKDIKLSGSTLFMESTLSLLKTACIAEAVRLENLTKNDTGSGSTILDEMLALSCSNNCSNVGSCINGTCQCENGYSGNDCSMSGNAPPILSQETNVGLCDTSINVCSKYLVSGENFMPMQLTCRAQPFKVYGSVIRLEGEAMTFSATYVNSFTCICKIPASRKRRSTYASLPSGYKISMSNDGTTFSTEVTFLNFDANCYECNTTSMMCTEKTGSCQTVNADPGPSVSDDTSETAIGVGVGVGIVILLVVIIVVFLCILKHKNRKSTAVVSLSNLRMDDEKVSPSQLYFPSLKEFPVDDSAEVIIGVHPSFQTYSKEKTDIVINDLE
ncbi:von Willebrand factor D and EGF domain-containing protein-like [Mizuhopecten yessoensis]|uniref:von Willebrand factor D and EGF domain-containing protein n=1 Tax=Mizuhopecten yessoensis TaxID=6573 RepID=A0A210PT41_MIZYE|nr:von Willebrand factor D and EGF domain-containing protein-like [Mizuhopecten yessoensis]OWF39670.1 von Willebrand factor D and EGF domain-containing protein [Mizuhopecten yessoensis]